MKLTFFKRKGQWYWRMTARNGKIIAIGGEGYERLQKCAAAVYSVVRFAGAVRVHDKEVCRFIATGSPDDRKAFVAEVMAAMKS